MSKYQKFITIVKLPQKLSEWQKLSNYPKIVRKKLSWPDLPCSALCKHCKINPKIAKYFKIVKLHQNCQINPDLNKLTNYPTVVELPQNCQKPELALNYCKKPELASS